MAEVLQVEFSGVLSQIDGVHILGRKQLTQVSYNTQAEQEHEKGLEKYKDMRELELYIHTALWLSHLSKGFMQFNVVQPTALRHS